MRFSSNSISGLIPTTPVAWATSRHLAIATGRILRTYVVDSSSSLRNPLAVLEGHTASITTVISLPNMRIASGSEDGTVRIWDVVTGHNLRTFDLACPVLHIVYAQSEQLLCLTNSALLQVRLARDRTRRRHQLVRKLLSNILSVPTRVAVSADSSIIAVADATNIHLIKLDSGGAVTTIRNKRVVTALAITKDGTTLAAADEAGVISLYYNPKQLLAGKRVSISREKATPTQLHWHAAAPLALVFAHHDTVLLSAGPEAVLVTWRLSEAQFGTRTFLPRLRSPILAISVSPDERTYAISQSDNAVRLIDQVSASVVHTIRAVPTRLLAFSDRNPKAHLLPRVDPQYIQTCLVAPDPKKDGGLWFAGADSSLQLFDVFHGTHVDEFQIIPRNASFENSSWNKNTGASQRTTVSGLTIHTSGRYLATIDCQDLRTTDSERYGTDEALYTLKFWRRESSNKSFVLDAVVSGPHGSDSSISSMSFHPTLPLLATASAASRSFKLWRATGSCNDVNGQWRSETEIDYKGMKCNDVCFSSDGSLLVVACEHVLTMWELEDRVSDNTDDIESSTRDFSSVEAPLTSPRSVYLEFLHCLVHPPSEEQVVSVAFMFKTAPLLIAVTQNGIYVWNVLSQSVWWSTRMRSDSRRLAVDQELGRFALQLVVPPAGTDGELSDRKEANGTGTTYAKASKPQGGIKTISAPKGSKEGNQTGEVQISMSTTECDPQGRPSEGDAFGVHDVAKDKSESFTCTDAAVAIYDVASPVPIYIHRLTTGAKVAALSFVKYPGETSQSASALVCVDSRMEVFIHSHDDKIRTSFPSRILTKDQILSNPLSFRNLEKILGKEELNRTDEFRRRNGSATSSDGAVGLATEMAFRTYFHGLTHVQAPAAVTSFNFVNMLLVGDQGRRKAKIQATRSESEKHEDRYSLDNIMNASGNHFSNVREEIGKATSTEDVDYRAIRAFCVSMVGKAGMKPARAR